MKIPFVRTKPYINLEQWKRTSSYLTGECNLCNGVVGWLLKFAPTNLFEFVPFQSPKGQKLLIEHGFPTLELTTVILF